MMKYLLVFSLLLCMTTSVGATGITPYWTEPGTPGDPNDNPLPPPGPSAGMTVTLNKGAALLANPAASAAFDLAAQYAESWIADPINMVIDVDLGSLGGSLGESNINEFSTSYDSVRTLMVNDQVAHVGAGDITDYLPSFAQFSASAALPAGFSLIGDVRMSRANAKALGVNPLFMVGGVNGSDGSITLDDAFSFDYDPTNGITAGYYDFFGVALHEIGHIMGFISEVDTIDFQQNLGQTSALTPTTMDLFRIGPGTGSDDAGFETASRILDTGGNPVMYLGAGVDAAFSTGETQGDGRSASHWKDNLGIGMMDPTLGTGENAVPDMSDLRAFDLIGWDTVPPVMPTPIPGAVWLFGSGLVLLIARTRKQRLSH